MSFAAQTKKELTMIEAGQACCERAELAALIRMIGTVQLTGKRIVLDVSTENAAIARRIFTLIKRQFGIQAELLVRKKMRLKKNNVYIVRVPRGVEELLKELKIVSEGFMFQPGIDASLIWQEARSTIPKAPPIIWRSPPCMRSIAKPCAIWSTVMDSTLDASSARRDSSCI